MKLRGGPHSFPKSLRLLRRAEFRRVYDEGQRRSAALCSIFYLPNGLPHTRLGITTPTAIGNAVVRNRVRRRLREVFRLYRATIPGGWDIVMNPRSAVATMPFRHLVEQMLRLFPGKTPSATLPPRGTPAVLSDKHAGLSHTRLSQKEVTEQASTAAHLPEPKL